MGHQRLRSTVQLDVLFGERTDRPKVLGRLVGSRLRGKLSVHECVTSVKTINYSYSWCINDFSDWCALSGEVPESATFSSNDGEELEWQLYFRPQSLSSRPHSALMLWLTKSASKKVQVDFKLSLLDGENKLIGSRSTKHLFTHERCGFGWDGFIERKRLMKRVRVFDKLIITCDIRAKVKIENELSITYNTTTVSDSLKTDLFNLLDDEKLTDVTFIIRGQDFPAHKCILAARSPVFAAMFSHSMQEAIDSIVNIPDVDPAVFKELLRFIYTDQVNDLDTMADRLYAAADKYDITALRSHCRKMILKKLSIETAGDALKLADLHSDRDMKARVLQFLRSRDAIGVTGTIGWQEMVATHPHLEEEAFKIMADSSAKEKKSSSVVWRFGRALLRTFNVIKSS
ncbi:roadkill [Culex quinquefasciatus]|uniref:Roadkill n=1 Tax=Culex quinquefasciatus TaxID=7176 RepID=B0WLH8_CULQU|nr:roadkill [Culex quinquefasciatus]|eukprot:XP_001849562.1 roadkill [Culex quinquefasciatus]